MGSLLWHYHRPLWRLKIVQLLMLIIANLHDSVICMAITALDVAIPVLGVAMLTLGTEFLAILAIVALV